MTDALRSLGTVLLGEGFPRQRFTEICAILSEADADETTEIDRLGAVLFLSMRPSFSGNPEIERAYRTPEILSEIARALLGGYAETR